MSDEELPPRALGQLRFTLHMHLHGMPHRFRIRPNLPSHTGIESDHAHKGNLITAGQVWK